MANEQNYQFARILSMKDLSEINRVLGIIEGLTYAVQDSGVADGLLNAIERIDAVINKEERLIQILEGAGPMIQFPGSLANILLENGVTFAKDNNVLTNADRIRAWNDHELAETISNFVSEIDNGDVRYSDDPNEWLGWLQQPAEE